MPNWTKEQQEAIDKEGTNIIVSAGAGSGKTAVLTERVLRKLKEGVNIDELLILTFTKAAASEMKERIRRAIKKEPSLANQLDYIDAAYITTFDSYALSVVKKFHDLLGISKSISVLDETFLNTHKKHILEEIFERKYQEEDPKFLKLIGDFCLKDDTEIKQTVLSMSSKLDLLPNKKEYLENYVKTHFNEESLSQDLKNYEQFLKHKIDQFQKEMEKFQTYVDGTYYEKLEQAFSPFFDSKDYSTWYSLKGIKFPTLPRGLEEEVKNKKKELADNWKSLAENFSASSLEELKETILSTKDYVEAIIDLLLTLEKEVTQYKRTKDAYEFSDIALLAIQLVQNEKEVREELKNHFQEILIDEYQDTNDLQETFIKEISNHNVYMVGDIKQSIYRFRNANPYLFQTKYENYSKGLDGMKIDLNKNFRSRREVLNNINYLFDEWMDLSVGGADYRNSHEMIFGNLTYEEEGKTNQNYDFEVYNYSYPKNYPYKKEEIEAFIVAKDIREKWENHYQIFDKDTKTLRDINYSDCVILMDRTTQFDLYKKVFEYFKIPLTLYKDETLTNSKDIYVLKNVLKLIQKISKKEQDTEFEYCFVSVARSFLYRMEDEEILKRIEEKNWKETNLYQTAFQISKQFDVLTCKSILKRVIDDFHFYEKLITVGDIEDAMVRLEYLGNMSQNLMELGYTIPDFISYLEEMIVENKDIRYSPSFGKKDACKIMTIHKSKGLEFPICYFTGLSKKFNLSDLKERFLYDSIYGIITPYCKEGLNDTFYKDLIKEKTMKEEIAEKIRLFYVALTRAKEKLIFISSLEEERELERENGVIEERIRLSYRSFEDMLNSILPLLKNYRKEIDIDSLNLSKSYLQGKQLSLEESISKSDISFSYQEQVLNFEKKDPAHFSKEIKEFLTKEEYENMKFGTAMHEELEYFDFKNPDTSYLSPFLKQKLSPLFESPILKDLEQAKIYQEYEFYDMEKEMHGVIDLMIEWEQTIIIIDYKLKNLKDSAYQKQLKGYQEYIAKVTNKTVTTYLYSILDCQLEKVI